MSVLHRPERFASPMAWATDFMRKERFGLLVSQLQGELHFSHLPVLVDVEGERVVRLRGHFARSNAHWQALQEDPRATFVFNGPHAYMSAQWYSPGCQAAPSWNFVTVHLAGRVRLLDTPQQTTDIVDELIAVNEAELPAQWDVRGYSAERRARLTPHILGFALDVEEVQPKFKLLQHYPDEDKVGAIAGLRSRGTDATRAIAHLMEQTLGQGSREMDVARRLGPGNY
ncbi:MAG: FMN-binding negative transcriptional regulator [Ramlibacter sp.]